uniref:SSD domain-containing protein n=1 Tax=Plectus sambesii TaxID=2011161 RepID=A0A914WR29_9BILA
MVSPGAWASSHIQRIFYNLGHRVGTHPFPFLIMPILLTVLSAVGLLKIYEENRIWYLYSPTYAPSHYEHAVATEFFQEKGGKFWVEVPVTARDTGNLLRPNYLEAVESLASYLLFNFTVPCNVDNQTLCSFDDLCVGKCNDNQIVPIFTLLYRNKTQRNHPNFRLTYPTMYLYNDEYYVGEQFSGVDVDQRTNVINSIRLIVLYFRTDMRSQPVANALTSWELQLLDYVDKLNHPLINISASSDGLISHEVRRNGFACIPYFGLSVTVVLLFSIASNFRRRDINISVGEAVCGVSGPLLAIGTTYGLVMLFVDFNSIVFIMPFLIIGIGVDDFFIMVHAWRMTNKHGTIAERAGKMMEEAGPSITITSLTNALSFMTGALTPTPAIRIFCLYTTAGVLIDFVYQTTFFAACIVFLNLREAKVAPRREKIGTVVEKVPSDHEEKVPNSIAANDAEQSNVNPYHEFVCWSKQKLATMIQSSSALRIEAIRQFPPSSGTSTEKSNAVKAHDASSVAIAEKSDIKHSHFIASYCKYLTNWSCRLLVYGIAIIYWMTAAYGWSKMQLKMDASNLILGDSPMRSIEWVYSTFTWRQAYSFYVDQLNSIAGNTLSTVVIALVIMALTCLLLIPNPISVISATAAMVSINVGVFGYLFLWDVNLDPITMCTVLMSIGFSVDFTAHISYHYYRNDSGWSNERRLADALSSIGYPMLQAGISTVLGIIPLLLVDSYMVYVFVKTVFLVIALGLIHGLLFLPALLLSIGDLNICGEEINLEFSLKDIKPEKPAIEQFTASAESSSSEMSKEPTEMVGNSSKTLTSSSSFPVSSDDQR